MEMCKYFWFSLEKFLLVVLLFSEISETLYDEYKPGSALCEQKAKCSEPYSDSWPIKNCYCDDLCGAFRDCCHGFVPLVDFDVPDVELFQCKYYPEIKSDVQIVSKCPKDWSDDNVRSLCENTTSDEDMLSRLPVSENNTDIVFKNMYCAHCNLRYDFNFWKPEIGCEHHWFGIENSNISDLMSWCDLNFLPPSNETRYRKCSTTGVNGTCPENTMNKTLFDGCENGTTLYVFTSGPPQRIFKNEACAECHNVSKDWLYCDPDVGTSDVPPYISYSFRILVDFNSISGEIGKVNEEKELMFPKKCADDEVYDPFSEKYRHIYCASPRIPIKGKCEVVNPVGFGEVADTFNSPQANKTEMHNIPKNCTLVKLEQSEYDIQNDKTLIVRSSGKVFENGKYYQLEDDLFVCHNVSPLCESNCETRAAFQSDIIEGYLTLILLVISLAALGLNFCIYGCFPQLRNIPGKILMCLIASLFLAQLFFLISPHLERNKTACMVSAIIVHYFYTAAFCWMNAIALDLWITFSSVFVTAGSNESSRRFIYFSLYAWAVPCFIVAFSVTIDKETGLKYVQPRYGDGACWMTSRIGVLVFFAGPLALFKLFDIIAFINTARHIYKAKKHGSAARQGNDSCTFWINLKLSLVMGLTWVFAFVANFANETFLWYLFIIFNAMQGVFIAASFVFTTKVVRLISEKAHAFTCFTGKSGTQEISMSGNAQLVSNSICTKFSSIPTSEL